MKKLLIILTLSNLSGLLIAQEEKPREHEPSFNQNEQTDLGNALIKAAVEGQVEKVKSLLKHEDKIFYADTNYALEKAAKAGKEDVVKLLLKHVDDDTIKIFAVAEAVKNGHTKIVKLILQQTKYIPLSHSIDESTEIAAENGDAEIVKLLLDFGATNSSKAHALIKAAENGHENIVKILLESGIKSGPRWGDTNYDRNTALQKAAENGYKNIVKILLNSGAKIRSDRVLINTAKNGHRKIVKLLLQHFPNTDQKVKVWIFTWAAQKGYKDIVEILFSSISSNDDKERALEAAAHNGHRDIVNFLRDQGVKGVKSKYGYLDGI